MRALSLPETTRPHAPRLPARLWTAAAGDPAQRACGSNGLNYGRSRTGAQVLTFRSDTRNAGTAESATVRFSNHHISSCSCNRHLLRLNDVYFCDTSGSHNDDFLGDVRVVTLRPNADTAQADFKPSSGSAHSTLVEEAPGDDGDASYVESGTVGHKDAHAGGDSGSAGGHRRPQG